MNEIKFFHIIIKNVFKQPSIEHCFDESKVFTLEAIYLLEFILKLLLYDQRDQQKVWISFYNVIFNF